MSDVGGLNSDFLILTLYFFSILIKPKLNTKWPRPKFRLLTSDLILIFTLLKIVSDPVKLFLFHHRRLTKVIGTLILNLVVDLPHDR